jgi:hypothetical protein
MVALKRAGAVYFGHGPPPVGAPVYTVCGGPAKDEIAKIFLNFSIVFNSIINI